MIGHIPITMQSVLISQLNRDRAVEWHSEGEEWSLADWSNALAGETGELCNIIKKLRRLETGVNARTSEQGRDDLIEKAKLEVADVWLYLDLLLWQLDPNALMESVVAHKFNLTSERFGFTHRVI